MCSDSLRLLWHTLRPVVAIKQNTTPPKKKQHTGVAVWKRDEII